MTNIVLDIQNLHVMRDSKKILDGLNLSITEGSLDAIMGPNGSGKSTLSYVIAGHPNYQVTQGTISYLGQNLLNMSVDERARAGIFLGFQYPIEIPGVSISHFLRLIYNSRSRQLGEKEVDSFTFLKKLKELRLQLGISEDMMSRSLNAGFSGGEKKKLEMLQMVLLRPTIAILDEADSGLDIDALKIVASTINQQRQQSKAIVLITHYKRLLTYTVPDQIHIMSKGKIVKTGNQDLALQLEEKGYDKVIKAPIAGSV